MRTEEARASVEALASPALPGGAVTFLFTDIEGSTRLLERLRDDYAVVLADQRDLLRACFARWRGFEVDTQGDSFFVAFPQPLDALTCAIEAQRALAEHEWPDGVDVRVRMALHTGEALVAATGYVGIEVHRAARIGAIGHGGQILVSDSTRRQVEASLPDGVELAGLGAHRLKDLRDPVEILQVRAPGLGSDFPELRVGIPADEPPAPGDAPFKGLLSFDEHDADDFFGRETLVARLLERLRRDRFLAVVGASGSGKSSVVRAGIVPALAAELPGGRAAIRILVPGAQPMEALDAAFGVAQPAPDEVLVVDQFEEVFTLCRDETQRRGFIDRLVAFPGRVVVVLRADFYSHLAPYAEIRQLVAEGQEYIGPLEEDELRAAIEEPARRHGWSFSPGLVDLLLRDVGDEPGALPLLSHALLETWNGRRGTVLTLKSYFESGGVRGAIARTAERVYGAELTPDQQPIARDIFLRLTELGEGTADTRRRASLRELAADGGAARETVREVLRMLADARLVTVGEDAAEVAHEALIREWPTLREWLTEDRDAIRLHRSLTESAEEWEVLGRDPDALLRGTRLAQALEWTAGDGTALNEVEREFVAASQAHALREQAEREAQRERELEQARALAEAERRRGEEAAQSARRLRRRAVVLAGALVVAAGLGVAAVAFGNQATTEATRATVRELSNAAVLNLDVDPERSILLALEAVGRGGGPSGRPLGEAEEALHRAVGRSLVERRFTLGEAQVVGVAADPGGRYVALLDSAGSAGVWDTEADTPRWTRTLPAPATHDQKVGLAFSPDGTLVAFPVDATVELVDAATGAATATLAGHREAVTGVAFSPDGRLVAGSSLDDTVIVWDAATGEQRRRIVVQAPGQQKQVTAVSFDATGTRLVAATADDEGGQPLAATFDVTSGVRLSQVKPGDWVASAALSPDGSRLVTVDYSTLVKTWDATSGALLWTGFGHSSLVHDVSFDPSGARFATGSADGTVRIWETDTGRQLQTVPGHAAAVFALQFSADGNRLVTAGGDGTGRVWNTSPSAGQEAFLFAHGDRVWSGSYSPDGLRFAYAGVDVGEAVVRDATTGAEILRWKPADGAGVTSINYAPDGSRLLTSSFNGISRVWDAASGELVLDLDSGGREVANSAWSRDGRLIATTHPGGAFVRDAASGTVIAEIAGHEGEVPGVAFSPDGTRLVTTALDQTARIWEIPAGRLVMTLQGHTGTVQRAAFSPDGRLITTTSNDGTARVWDAATGTTLHVLTGHTSPIYGVAFSRDGRRLATAGIDSTIKIWEVAALDSSLPLTLRGHRAAVYDVEWSPDGHRLLSTSRDQTARVWALDPAELATLARDRLTRSLTDEECQQYLHVPACP